jgi:hypothetical protein
MVFRRYRAEYTRGGSVSRELPMGAEYLDEVRSGLPALSGFTLLRHGSGFPDGNAATFEKCPVRICRTRRGEFATARDLNANFVAARCRALKTPSLMADGRHQEPNRPDRARTQSTQRLLSFHTTR